MQIVVLAIFSFVLAARSEDVFEVNHEVASVGEEFAASNLYDSIFSQYFNEKPSNNKQNSKKNSRNKNVAYRNPKEKQPAVKIHRIPEYIRYDENPQDKVEYEKLVGRKGLGFDKRVATSYGMRAPITAKSLEIADRKYYENKGNKDFTIFV